MPYAPESIMENLAWQWRDHHDDISSALLAFSGNYPDKGFKIIYDHQDHNPGVQGMYGDYVRDNGIPSFFNLLISSAYPDHPSDLNVVKAGIDFLRHNWPGAIQGAHDYFQQGLNVYAIHALFFRMDHDPGWEETCRATYRDNRPQLIALVHLG